jgi:PEP-CTERM motif
MNNIKTRKYLSAALMLGALGTSAIAQAGPCTVSLATTNPDGKLSSATACGDAPGVNPASTQIGIVGDNPGGLGLPWNFIDRDDSSNSTDNGFSITGAGDEDGKWLINKDHSALASYNNFIVTLKGGSPLQNDFLWFLIDTSAGANACSSSQAAAGWDLCGTWDMYGTGGDAKNVGHMDLFAATQGGGNTGDGNLTRAVPEPSTTLLAGIGLLGLALGRKRVLKSTL